MPASNILPAAAFLYPANGLRLGIFRKHMPRPGGRIKKRRDSVSTMSRRPAYIFKICGLVLFILYHFSLMFSIKNYIIKKGQVS